jgi:L-malate glycosyltransferase
MRIALLIDQVWDPLAGTENQLLKLIHGLGPRHELHLICLRSTQWLEREGGTLPCQVRVIRIDGLRRLHTYANGVSLCRFLRRLRPDVLHTFFPVGNIVGPIAARIAGVRAVVASRRDYGEWMSPRYLRLTRLANRCVDRILSNSTQVARMTTAVEGFDAGRIAVIPNAIELERFHVAGRNDALRAQLGVPAGGSLVGLIANYRPMKRHATLVRAARRILDRRDDVRFVLVGRNATPLDLRGEIAALIGELGLQDKVFQMHTGGVTEVLAGLDVAVNCSQGEGLSNAIMEAMAAGVPVVASASGGNPDLVSDGHTGLTFELDNDVQLAERILALLDDRALGRRLADNALRRLRAEMAPDIVVARFEAFYAALAGPNGVAAGALA